MREWQVWSDLAISLRGNEPALMGPISDVGETRCPGRVVPVETNVANEPRIYCDLNRRMLQRSYLPTNATTRAKLYGCWLQAADLNLNQEAA